MSTLCGNPASWLEKSMVTAFPAGAARQFVSKATPLAVIFNVVPDGAHCAADALGLAAPVAFGWGEKAKTRPPAGGRPTSRFSFTVSYHARTSFLPSALTPMLGFAPPRLSGTAELWKVPPEFVASMTSFLPESAQV